MEIESDKHILIFNNNVIKFERAHCNELKSRLTLKILTSEVPKLDQKILGASFNASVTPKKIIFISIDKFMNFINLELIKYYPSVIDNIDDTLNDIDFDVFTFEYEYLINQNVKNI